MGDLQGALESRRGQVERSRSMQGRVHRLVGFIETTGAGESLAEVRFPAWFIERPSISFGGEMAENEVLVDGDFPTVSVVVKSWIKELRYPATYYIGASLALVTTGSPVQKMIIHWQAEGIALVNPMLVTGGTDDAI